MSKIRVLVAVKSLALQHLIEHLLKTRPDLELRIGRGDADKLALAVRRSVPNLVIANSKLSGAHAQETAALLKRSSPGSKLILICSVEGFESELRKWGADACLAEEALVRQLVPTVSELSSSRN